MKLPDDDIGHTTRHLTTYRYTAAEIEEVVLNRDVPGRLAKRSSARPHPRFQRHAIVPDLDMVPRDVRVGRAIQINAVRFPHRNAYPWNVCASFRPRTALNM